jgi:hypothetical protein
MFCCLELRGDFKTEVLWSAMFNTRLFDCHARRSSVIRDVHQPDIIMKTKLQLLLTAVLGLTLISAEAQPRQRGGGGGGMGGMGGQKADIFAGGLKKILGDNKTFSAKMEIEATGPTGAPIKMPAKIAYNDGKSRMEMDMTKGGLPEEMLAQIKAMGMAEMIIISRPDKKVAYMIYPGLKAYAEMPLPESESAENVSKYKVETKELAKESVEGQACAKNKVTVTDDKDKKTEFTIWQATDLKKFPVKIISTESGEASTMTFKEVKLTKPDDSQFDAPKDFKKYDNFMALMMEQMKGMGGPGGPPGR